MFRQNGPWLGQVRLVSGPSLGTKMGRPEDMWKDPLPTPPKDAKFPSASCLFLGIRLPVERQLGQFGLSVDDIRVYMLASLNNNIESAQKAGYEITETDTPNSMCPVVDPNRDPNIPTKLNEVPASAPCYEAGSKFVWACPGTDSHAPKTEQDPQAQPVQTLPPGPKPDLVPVAAGAGVVAILAAVIAGAFGK